MFLILFFSFLPILSTPRFGFSAIDLLLIFLEAAEASTEVDLSQVFPYSVIQDNQFVGFSNSIKYINCLSLPIALPWRGSLSLINDMG